MSIDHEALAVAHRCESIAGYFLAGSMLAQSKGRIYISADDWETAQEWALHAALMREWAYANVH